MTHFISKRGKKLEVRQNENLQKETKIKEVIKPRVYCRIGKRMEVRKSESLLN
jgi:hypothetical protein